MGFKQLKEKRPNKYGICHISHTFPGPSLVEDITHLDRDPESAILLLYTSEMNAGKALNVVTCGAFEHMGKDIVGYSNFPEEIHEKPIVHNAVFVVHTDIHGETTDHETLVHESGHYFGLYHTFEGGCTDPGDSIEDTPREDNPESATVTDCSVQRDTCDEEGVDPIHDFMDYT